MFPRLIFLLALVLAPLIRAAPPQLVLMIGEDEYKTWETLPAFAGAAQSPILRGVGVAELSTSTVLYKVSPLAATTTPVLFGTFGHEPAEPVAWTHLYGANRARVFVTSLGGPDDFAHPAFRRLLGNGVQWALGQ